MLKRLLIVVCTGFLELRPDCGVALENSYFALQRTHLEHYNRLRLEPECYTEAWFAFASLEVSAMNAQEAAIPEDQLPWRTTRTLYAEQPLKAWVRPYRLYGGFDDGTHRLSLGLQSIAVGVGRIWTPTNRFTPRRSIALDPLALPPAAALHYTLSPTPTAQLTALLGQRRDHSLAGALRAKALFGRVEAALDALYADEERMIGFELEGAVSGIGVRSEAAWTAYPSDRAFEGIVGADGAFGFGLIYTLELHYAIDAFALYEGYDAKALWTLGQRLEYPFGLFYEAALLYLEQGDARLFAPALSYRPGDRHAFTLGALLGYGVREEHVAYLRYDLAF
ncbi:MAG: hypothetical protein JXK05_03055 [Campylobacterales bacterium]|nr:hypothetical protein [Campylobacterales bacterium]